VLQQTNSILVSLLLLIQGFHIIIVVYVVFFAVYILYSSITKAAAIHH